MANMAKKSLSLHRIPALIVRAVVLALPLTKKNYSFSAWMNFAPSLQASYESGSIEAGNIEARSIETG